MLLAAFSPARSDSPCRPVWRRGAGFVLFAALASGACMEDSLYPEGEVTGPDVTLVPHKVSVSMSPPVRMELGDSFRVTVRARSTEGASGIAQIGATVLIRNTARSDVQVMALGPVNLAPPQIGPVSQAFTVRLPAAALSTGGLPDTLTFEVHGYAVTAAGSCAAAVEESEQQLPCADLQGSRVAENAQGRRAQVIAVAGTTGLFPGIGADVIGDLVVDTRTGRAFLSNRAAHRVEVLDLGTMTFGSPVSVGSQPWGLSLGRTGDTLMIANSGGTNVSFIPTGTLQEDLGRRFQIPRVTLYQVEYKLDPATLAQRYIDIEFFNYVDRPQFITQDAAGRLLYSAGTTQAAPVGTIRVAQWRPGWQTWDAQILFHNRAIQRDTTWIAIANADDVDVVGETQVIITDHLPGAVPTVSVSSGALPVFDAVAQLRALGSDVVAVNGIWRVPEGLELSDTTFVASSGDRRWVAFGEGVDTPAGRVILWNSDLGVLSRVEDIQDILNNTSDRMTGIDLNQNGTLGVARGQKAAYFFGNDLRLQGLTPQATPGGAGATFLPGSTGSSTLAFAGTAQGSIRVIETTHYSQIGEVLIRDAVVGPVRVVPAGANACPADFRQGAPTCVVARLYALTTRGVVSVDVLRRDVQ